MAVFRDPEHRLFMLLLDFSVVNVRCPRKNHGLACIDIALQAAAYVSTFIFASLFGGIVIPMGKAAFHAQHATSVAGASTVPR